MRRDVLLGDLARIRCAELLSPGGACKLAAQLGSAVVVASSLLYYVYLFMGVYLLFMC